MSEDGVMPRTITTKDLDALRKYITSSRHVQSKYEVHARQLDMPWHLYLNKRTIFGEKWCKKCNMWRHMSTFHQDKSLADGCQTYCYKHRDLSPNQKRRHEQGNEKHCRKWSRREVMILRLYAGRWPCEDIAKKLGRTRKAVLRKAVVMKISVEMSYGKDVANVTYLTNSMLREALGLGLAGYETIERWSRRGMVTRKISRYHGVSRNELNLFLKRRPEALDLRKVSDETLNILGIDRHRLPALKIVTCSHCGTVARVPLYPLEAHCPNPSCPVLLPYWSTGGYVLSGAYDRVIPLAKELSDKTVPRVHPRPQKTPHYGEVSK